MVISSGKKIARYIRLFFTKLALFCRRNVEYVAFIKVSIGIWLLYNFLYYQYCSNNYNLKENNDLLLYQDIVANFLIPSLTTELHENSNINYLFCFKKRAVSTISLTKLMLLNREIFCDTRVIKEKIDELLPKYINYSIHIDNLEVISSINSTELLKKEKRKYYNIDVNGKHILKVNLSIDPYSSYKEQVKHEINDKILYVFYLSSFFTLSVMAIFIPFIKKYKDTKNHNIFLSKEYAKLDIIKNSRQNIQVIIDEFYKYHRQNYQYFELSNNGVIGLPISLVKSTSDNIEQVFEIYTEKIIKICDFLIKEYNILHSYNIKFTSDVITKVQVPFEQELFDQIIMSIVSNLLLFIKSNKHNYHICLIIDTNTILFAHDIFNIDEAMMIEYSEMIFQETLNPYILTFKQVTNILNKTYNLHCKIYNEFTRKLIKIVKIL